MGCEQSRIQDTCESCYTAGNDKIDVANTLTCCLCLPHLVAEALLLAMDTVLHKVKA